jgi:replicative DNA helicase
MFEFQKLLLRVLGRRALYQKLRNAVMLKPLDLHVKNIIKALDLYWKDTAIEIADTGVLATVLDRVHKDSTDDDKRMYGKMLSIMREEPNEEAVKGLVKILREIEFDDRVGLLRESFNEGEDIDIFSETKELLHEFETDLRTASGLECISESFQEMLDDEESGHRFVWPLKCLAGSLPNSRTGRQIIFGARPGTGKTSFMAFTAVAFAKAAPKGRPIVWFNNEDKGVEVFRTIRRSALRRTIKEISGIGADKAHELFIEATGGENRIRVYDVHTLDHRRIENIIEEQAPSAVIFDMLDNVAGFNNASRNDTRLENLYQWARSCAAIYDFLSLPVKQVSVEGDDLAWVPASALKDSKTGVQGACNEIITMGYKIDPKFINRRYLNIPKTKQTPEVGFRADCKTEVVFDPDRAIFKDIEVSS